MKSIDNSYIVITDSSGIHKRYQADTPDSIINEMPVELQELTLSSDGKGYRTAYNYRSISTLEFSPSNFPSPLKAKLHKHEYFEFIMVASGKLEMQIESRLYEFSRGDICILNCSTRHAEHFRPDSKVLYIVLSPEYLSTWPTEPGMIPLNFSFFGEFLERGTRLFSHQNKDFITAYYTCHSPIPPLFGIANEILCEFKARQVGYQLIIRGLIYRMLNSLTLLKDYETEYINMGNDESFSLAFLAKQLLDKRKQKITKTEIAEKLNYSSEYINKVFKKHYDKTIPEYNRMILLQHAALLLCSTDIPIYQICKQLGFTNRTHFYELFKQVFGVSPADYRKTGG